MQHSASMLEEIDEALDRKDMTALELTTRKAKALQAEVKKLEQLEQQLRQQYESN